MSGKSLICLQLIVCDEIQRGRLNLCLHIREVYMLQCVHCKSPHIAECINVHVTQRKVNTLQASTTRNKTT